MSAELRVEGLRKQFTIGKPAVDGVSFHVPAGEIVVLLGPSGCGKTTTLRCVAGLEHPTAGRISIGGRVVSAPTEGIMVPPRLRNIGMVFQSYAVWPHMTVKQNVVYPLRHRGVPRGEIERKVAAVLDLVGLSDLATRAVVALSGGQMQRVALARSLVYEPALLLLDEPLSNLDAQLRLRLRDDLRRIIKQAGVTALYVTHDQAEAMTLASRIAVIDEGKLLQFDTPWNVYHRPVNLFVAGFLGSPSMNFLEGRLENGMVVHPAMSIPAPVAVRPRLTIGVRPEDVEVSPVEQAGWSPARVYVVESMGNESFVRLNAESAQLTARVPVDMALDFDRMVWFRIRPGKARFFDTEKTEAVE